LPCSTSVLPLLGTCTAAAAAAVGLHLAASLGPFVPACGCGKYMTMQQRTHL
jgi:hypothetical protein